MDLRVGGLMVKSHVVWVVKGEDVEGRSRVRVRGDIYYIRFLSTKERRTCFKHSGDGKTTECRRRSLFVFGRT